MHLAAGAADSFRSWLGRGEHEPYEDLGYALTIWVQEGGAALINEDYTIFLQAALIVAADPEHGLIAGKSPSQYRYRVVGGRHEILAIGSSDWPTYLDPDMFAAAVYRYQHPAWTKKIP